MKHPPFVLLALLALTGTAAAQDRPPADRVHDFHSLDRQTPQTTFGFALGYELWDNDAIDTILGIELAGHFVSDTGVGAYLTLPLSYLSTDDVVFIEGDSELAIGNVEIGGLFVVASQNVDMVFHGGIALPTADDDPGVEQLAPLASTPRWGDYVQRIPNSTWLRLAFSPMGRASLFFWRADLGVDLAIDDEDGTSAGAELSPIIRANIGGGIDLGSVDVTAELATNIVDDDSADDDDSASTLAIGARFGAGNTYPGIALILPLGFDGLEDQLDAVLAFSLTARM